MARNMEPSRRIACLHGQMHKLTQFRVTQLLRRKEALRLEKEDLVQHLGDAVTSKHGDAGLINRRLRANARELAGVDEEIARQSRLLSEHGMRMKRAELIAEQREAEMRALDERRALGDIIEAAVARQGASLR